MFNIITNSSWANADFPVFTIIGKDLQIYYWHRKICYNKISSLREVNNPNNVKYNV